MSPKPNNRSGTRSLTQDGALHSSAFKGSSPFRKVKIAAVLFGLVLAAAVLLSVFGGGGSESSNGSAPKPPPQAGGSGTSASAKSTKHGVPVGYPRTEQGVVAAAVNYEVARSTPDYFSDSELRKQILQTVMTGDAADSQIKQDEAASKALVNKLDLGGDDSDLVMRAAPLGTKVVSYSPETATVEVWMSELVGVAKDNTALPVSGSWTTYSMVLQWQEGDWKVASLNSSSGPTPATSSENAPSSSSTFRTANEEFNAPPYSH